MKKILLSTCFLVLACMAGRAQTTVTVSDTININFSKSTFKKTVITKDSTIIQPYTKTLADGTTMRDTLKVDFFPRIPISSDTMRINNIGKFPSDADGLTFARYFYIPATAGFDDVTVPLPKDYYFSFILPEKANIKVYATPGTTTAINPTTGKPASRNIVISDGVSELTKTAVTVTGTIQTVEAADVLPGRIYIYNRGGNANYYLVQIVSTKEVTLGIDETTADHGEIVSVRYYDVTGREVPAATTGIVLKRVRYVDGTYQTIKTYIRK